MTIKRKLHIAQLACLITALVLFETLHTLNAHGLFYLLVVVALAGAFYFYAGTYRCPRCGARLFPPFRLTTPFVPDTCGQCGLDLSKPQKNSELS